MIQYIYCSLHVVDFFFWYFWSPCWDPMVPKKRYELGDLKGPMTAHPSLGGGFKNWQSKQFIACKSLKPQAGCSVTVLVGADSDSSIRCPLDLWDFHFFLENIYETG